MPLPKRPPEVNGYESVHGTIGTVPRHLHDLIDLLLGEVDLDGVFIDVAGGHGELLKREILDKRKRPSLGRNPPRGLDGRGKTSGGF